MPVNVNKWNQHFKNVPELTQEQKEKIAQCLDNEAMWLLGSKIEEHAQAFLLNLTFQLLCRMRNSFEAVVLPAFIKNDKAWVVNSQNFRNQTSRLFAPAFLKQTDEYIEPLLDHMIEDYFGGTKRGDVLHLYTPVMVGTFLPPPDEDQNNLMFGLSWRGVYIAP